MKLVVKKQKKPCCFHLKIFNDIILVQKSNVSCTRANLWPLLCWEKMFIHTQTWTDAFTCLLLGTEQTWHYFSTEETGNQTTFSVNQPTLLETQGRLKRSHTLSFNLFLFMRVTGSNQHLGLGPALWLKPEPGPVPCRYWAWERDKHKHICVFLVSQRMPKTPPFFSNATITANVACIISHGVFVIGWE